MAKILTGLEQLDILKKYVEGVPLQFNSYNTWVDVDSAHLFDFCENIYRVKPESHIRPWKDLKEIRELGNILRMTVRHNQSKSMYNVCGIEFDNEMQFMGLVIIDCNIVTVLPEVLAKNYQISSAPTSNSTTSWRPCGIDVSSESLEEEEEEDDYQDEEDEENDE